MVRKVSKSKIPPSKCLPAEHRLSVVVEDAMAEVSEKIFTRLWDDGFIPDRIHKDTNLGTDLLNAIEDELRKCIRG